MSSNKNYTIRYYLVVMLIVVGPWIMAQDSLLHKSSFQSDVLLPKGKLLQDLNFSKNLINRLDSLNSNPQWAQSAQQKLDSISGLPDYYLSKIDSLLQAKAQLLQSQFLLLG